MSNTLTVIFSREYFQDFEKNKPDIAAILKNWPSSQDEMHIISAFGEQRPLNQTIISLYAAKHAPNSMDIKKYAIGAVNDYIANVFNMKNTAITAEAKTVITDNILDFMADDKELHAHFSKIINLWKASEPNPEFTGLDFDQT